MSEQRWTPGPWKAEYSCVITDGTNGDGEVLTSFVNGAVVRGDSDEDYATAKLVAAAPELADYVRDKADKGCEEASRLWRKCCGDD